MARITFVLSCLVLCGVLVSVDAGCEFFDNCGACVADHGCGWCSNDPLGVGSGIMSSVAGNGGLNVEVHHNEGQKAAIGGSDKGLPEADQIINVRGQYNKVTSVDTASGTATLDQTFVFEATGYIASPYFGFTSHDVTRGKQIVGVHKTKFLTELKAGRTVQPYGMHAFTVQSVQGDTMLSTTENIISTFDHLEFNIGNYQASGTISYPDTSKTQLHGSYAPNPSKFTTELKSGYTIATSQSNHYDLQQLPRVGQVVNDHLLELSSKFIQTFADESLWVLTGPRGTGLISGTAGQSRITGSDPCPAGHECRPETEFLKEVKVDDYIEIFNGTHRSIKQVASVEDNAHLTISECLVEFYNANGEYCVGMDDSFEAGKLPPTSTFKVLSVHNAPFTYSRAVDGKVISTYKGKSARAQVPVTVDQTSMGGTTVSLTHFLEKDYGIIVQTNPGAAKPEYETRLVKKVTKQNEIIVDRKFTTVFDNTQTGGSSSFWIDSCPSLTYENFDDRVENGPGLISGTGASYTYDNTQYAEITSVDAHFEENVRVGYGIILRNIGVERRVTKIVTDTKIHVNKPFNPYTNDAPTGFSNHAWQYVVRKGWDKNGIRVANEDFDKKDQYGSDYQKHWKPKQNTGGNNARQQGAIANLRALYSHSRKSSTTVYGSEILMQDPYILFPPVCYNHGRCVPKTSHSLVGVEKRINNADGTARKGEIASSSSSNPIHDLVQTGSSQEFYTDCQDKCTVTACKDSICETKTAVSTVNAHNSTHMYVEVPFSYNATGARSQHNNKPVPGFVPAGVTAYNTYTDIEFRVRFVTGTGYVHWCPAGETSNDAADLCDPKTLTGASKETKTKFSSETSVQWTLTIPCAAPGSVQPATAENRTISQVVSDTKIVVHDAFTNNNNKVTYCIGNIPALGRATNPQGHTIVHGDQDTRFLEQLKVHYEVSIGMQRRTITSIESNNVMHVNKPFHGGINTKQRFYYSGKVGTGEVSTAQGSTDVIGTVDVTQTKFNEELQAGYLIMVADYYRVITEVTSATTLSVDLPFDFKTHAQSGQTYGIYKNSFNYESCFTYDIGLFADADLYQTKHVYVEDACEIKTGCCGMKISSVVYPDRFAYYKVRPSQSNMNIRVVVTTEEDNIELIARRNSVPTTSSYDYKSERHSNPYSITIPAQDLTCNDNYVGYNVSSTLGPNQDHIIPPNITLVDDTSTLDIDAVELFHASSYAPSNCSYIYIGVKGDNRYPQKTGASEYTINVHQEFDFPNFLCGDAGEFTGENGDGKNACRILGVGTVEDAKFVMDDNNKAVMRLTPSLNMRKGAMWYGTKVHIADGFETTFQFRISKYTVGCNSYLQPSGFCGGGDGFAFLVHDAVDGDMDIGCYGGAMGFATMAASSQGDDYARPRCTSFSAASAGTTCDSGINGPPSDTKAINNPADITVNNQDDGVFSEACALMALCDPLNNGCGGNCGMHSCEQAIGRVLAIEFDTWNNLNLHDPKQGVSRWWINATEYIGYNDNHLAIFSSDSAHGTSNDHSSPNHFAATPSIPNLADGKNHTVKIKYWPQTPDYSRENYKPRGIPHNAAVVTNGDCLDNTGATDQAQRKVDPSSCAPATIRNKNPGNLAVFVDDMKKPVLQTKISLINGDVNGNCHDSDFDRCILDNQGNAYIGFSAATGGERTGVTMDHNGVTESLHQADISNGDEFHPAAEAAKLKTGAAQTMEILSWQFCNKHGCVAV